MLGKFFYIKKLTKNRKKNPQDILETKQNHTKIDVAINLETYSSMKFSNCSIFEATIFRNSPPKVFL